MADDKARGPYEPTQAMIDAAVATPASAGGMGSAQEPALKPEELLPCPFCGGRRIGIEWSITAKTRSSGNGDVKGIGCSDCGAMVPNIWGRDLVAAAWNTRTAPPAAAPVGELRQVGLSREQIARIIDPFAQDWSSQMTTALERADAILSALAAAPVGESRV